MRVRLRRWVQGATVALTCLATSGCGYSLAGQGSFLPEYVETIGIPLFVNNTAFFELEQTLTQAVRTEFIGRGNYQVVPEETGVDAVVVGRIVQVQLRPTSFTGRQQASRYAFTLTASIVMRDLRAREVLWENDSLIFTEEYDVATGGGALDASSFFGQDRNALDRMAGEFATTVVSSILEAF
ncbi:MAG: LPS assembly lipoprotein LptE [Vicinamibacterales bacterium]|mgnify:CR=1 FL=1|nr:LPS assembly lipoprotein LptE [Vicinamibacterales bacterium]MDP7672840.1 LPS assembly lipoprotein LptE [Vicinamibacterales bacterium]